MKKFTFGTPEKLVPSRYCDNFRYNETDVSFTPDYFSFKVTDKGCIVEFPISHDTKIYGFGLQHYQFNEFGNKITVRCNADSRRATGDSHAPVPFFVTNKGYGMYFDTARYAEFYCGKQKSGNKAKNENYEVKLSENELYAAKVTDDAVYMSVFIPVSRGVDVYVIEGDTITGIVSQYNMMAGGGCDVPEWGLGVLYRCNGNYTDKEILQTAKYMRDNDIPCDIIGIEPGWHTHAYSCTYKWNKERFPEPEKFVDKLRSMDFHVNLWEHAFVHPDCDFHDEMIPYSGDYCVWGGLVPDFSLPEARKIFADYHKKNFASMGIDGFKADECDGSDYTGGWTFPNHTEFPSGLDGEQYHNLFGVLYAKTMKDGLDGKSTLSEVRSLGALASSYPFVIYSDLSDIKAYLTATVNAGFSGLLWSPEVRQCRTAKELIRRLQLVTFSSQCLINAWSSPVIPWLEHDCVDEVRSILKMRKQIIPELKQAYDRYRDEGIPPVRALVMDFTDDAQVTEIDDEYMFCENLLVAPIIDFENDTRNIYLPEGKWIDYHTGKAVQPGHFEYTSENIPVFRKIE